MSYFYDPVKQNKQVRKVLSSLYLKAARYLCNLDYTEFTKYISVQEFKVYIIKKE